MNKKYEFNSGYNCGILEYKAKTEKFAEITSKTIISADGDGAWDKTLFYTNLRKDF